MASPQKENGYTVIANEILEGLVRYRIPGEQMQCLLFILRKTYGYNKKSDQISISQFQLATGLKKPSVVRALTGLLKKNVIGKKVKNKISIYWFNKNHDLWIDQAKKKTYTPTSSLLRACYLCGYDEVIDRHHIVHQADGGSDRVENIICLCPNCHAKVHRGAVQATDLLKKKKQVEEGFKKSLTKKLTPIKETQDTLGSSQEDKINNHVNGEPTVKKALSKKIHTKDIITKDIYSDKLTAFVGNFISFIKNTRPKQLPRSKNLEANSLDTVHKLMDIDKFDLEYIRKVIGWAVKDDFWGDQVFSLAGLRKKSKSGLTKFQNISAAYDREHKVSEPAERVPVFRVVNDD